MNQGRIWCVVNPTVGLPLLLGSVATISFIVHGSVMTHTTWMSNYWQGKLARTPSASNDGAAQKAGFSIAIAPMQAESGAAGQSFVVTMTPTTPAEPATSAAATLPATDAKPIVAASTE